MSFYRAPENLLNQLGIDSPGLIEIEAIAQFCAATIVYEPIDGSAARILGFHDKAIITVDNNCSRERQRFSAAHELGHWMIDRGQISHFVCTEKQIADNWSKSNPETRANRFAAELLLPVSMFGAEAGNKDITFSTVKYLANTFRTSLTATAIRLVEKGNLPCMLICCERGKKRWDWYVRSPLVPDKLWPSDFPGEGTLAHEILYGSGPQEAVEVGSWGWFDYPDADRHFVHEDSIPVRNKVLSLLWWKNESQLIELEDQS